MPYFKIWRTRSALMKLTCISMGIAVLLHSFTIVSRHWAVKGEQELGLFAYITQQAQGG